MSFRKLLRKIFQSNKQQQELSMLPKKYSHLPEHFSLLFEWGNPVLRGSGSYCHWENYLPYGFSDADVPALLELMNDSELNESQDENEVWVPLYAWRILGQLESVEAVDSLMGLFEKYEDDDQIASEIPVVLALIGEPVMALFAGILLDENEGEFRKNLASDTLYEMTLKHPELRENIVGHFRQYLQSPSPDYRVCNSAIVGHLMDMNAVELIDEIRTLYKNGYTDTRLGGDIEDVEIGFGLREDPFFVPDDPLGEKGSSQLRGATRSGVLNRPAPEMPGTYVREVPKAGRNEPCPCGSGKKYKRCCMNTSAVTS